MRSKVSWFPAYRPAHVLPIHRYDRSTILAYFSVDMKPIFAAVGLGCTFVISTAVLFLLARHHITVTSLSRNHVHGHGDDVGDGHGCDLGSESKSDEDSKGSNSSE